MYDLSKIGDTLLYKGDLMYECAEKSLIAGDLLLKPISGGGEFVL